MKADDLLHRSFRWSDAIAPKGADGNATRDGKHYVAESDKLYANIRQISLDNTFAGGDSLMHLDGAGTFLLPGAL